MLEKILNYLGLVTLKNYENIEKRIKVINEQNQLLEDENKLLWDRVEELENDEADKVSAVMKAFEDITLEQTLKKITPKFEA